MKAAVSRTVDALEQVILGKPQELRLALACLLAQGHLLIEDVPGVGKTTLALALARVLGLEFQRIQFTAWACRCSSPAATPSAFIRGRSLRR